MKKLTMLGIISGAALLTVAPFSLQWSQDKVFLSLNSANAIVRPLTATCIAGVHRRVYRRTYRRAAYAAAAAAVAGYGYGTYYGYSSPYYSSYYAPQPYSVSSYASTNPPSRYSYYVPPFETVSSYGYPPIPLQLLPATLCGLLRMALGRLRSEMWKKMVFRNGVPLA